MTVNQYREALIDRYGKADESRVRKFASWRAAKKIGKSIIMAKVNKAGRHCRLGDRCCTNYKPCCDKCRLNEKRITEMTECPEDKKK